MGIWDVPDCVFVLFDLLYNRINQVLIASLQETRGK